jgi:DNA-binding HxlR family transcriptional regulator
LSLLQCLNTWQLDLEVFGLLEQVCFPQHQLAVYTRLMELGEDVVDVLAAAAHCSTSSMFIGLAYQVMWILLPKLL